MSAISTLPFAPATSLDPSATALPSFRALTPEQSEANSDWLERDHQIAAGILSTTVASILSAHIHLLDLPFLCARSVYDELVRLYGTSGAQYSFALGRRFIDGKCGESEDVEACVNKVQAQYLELTLLTFDLDSLCINVPLNGLLERFTSFVDQAWIAGSNPLIDDIRNSILRINAGQLNRSNDEVMPWQLG